MTRNTLLPHERQSLAHPARNKRLERVYEPYHARVRGLNGGPKKFKEFTVIDNISAGGLHLHLGHRVEPGTVLTVVVRFSTESFDGEGGTTKGLAVRGVVLRAEPKDDGRCGVAVAFTHHRFLKALCPEVDSERASLD